MMRYDLHRVLPDDGDVHYAFIADDERKDAMLEVQANGAPTEWVWSCEAATADEANQALNDLMEETTGSCNGVRSTAPLRPGGGVPPCAQRGYPISVTQTPFVGCGNSVEIHRLLPLGVRDHQDYSQDESQFDAIPIRWIVIRSSPWAVGVL
jgi:hypothetical protein